MLLASLLLKLCTSAVMVTVSPALAKGGSTTTSGEKSIFSAPHGGACGALGSGKPYQGSMNAGSGLLYRAQSAPPDKGSAWKSRTRWPAVDQYKNGFVWNCAVGGFWVRVK